MTLIECFNHSLIENISVCLRLRPNKLILLGYAAEMAAPAKRYGTILRQRGLHTKVQLCDIHGQQAPQISGVLRNLVRAEPDCVIDLTDGDETVVMAIGALICSLDNPRICALKYDGGHDDITVLFGHLPALGKPPVLSVSELVSLHGGIIHPSSYQPPESVTAQQLAPLWEIVSRDPKAWNRSITVLAEIESRSESKTEISLSLSNLQDNIQNFHEKEALLYSLLDLFRQKRIIKDRSHDGNLRYTYTDPLFRYCTQKAGNVLEIKTLLEARALLDKGKPFFNDCQTSVNIDWDGFLYDPAERVPETRNEVDIVLMHGTVPLFISCKNGNIGDEELYKLHTVACRFGGPHVRKMLIATDLDQKAPAANRAFSQRAWDMDIFLVTDAAELTRQEWQQTFLQAVK